LRVLLDAHVSSRHIGRPLAAAGHDVLALDQDQSLSRLPDEDVLEFAAERGRIVVTHNQRHFAPIVRRWAEAGRTHSGCILVTLAHTEYGAILRGLHEAFAARARHEDWTNRAEFISREF
jgi:uncharacterized protein DUF5615